MLTHDLKSARLQGMAVAMHHWLSDPANAGRSALECVEGLLAIEQQQVSDKRLAAFQQRHRLPPHLTLGAFRASVQTGLEGRRLRDLRTLAWLDMGQNLVITGPTRSGKTHLAAGFASDAVLAGRTVKFVRVPDLLAQITPTHSQASVEKVIESLARAHLLVLDDFAVDVATVAQTAWLRRLLDRRSGRKGAVIVTAIPHVDEWGQFFENPVAAEGIFGRLEERAHLITLKRPGSQRGPDGQGT